MMANATSTELQALYIAYFARPADPVGLDYWAAVGITTINFAENMYLQQEFISVNGSLSIQEQINNIYQNLFFRDADLVGVNYWTQQIQTGKLVLASIANDLIWAANNNEGSEDDKTCLNNRVSAAFEYTAKIKETTTGVICYKPDSFDPWVDGELEKGKSYMKEIGCGGDATIFRPSLIEKWLPCGGNQGVIIATQLQSTLKQTSNEDCSCNNDLKELSTDFSHYSSLVTSNIDSLIDHSPYGLTSSNNIVVESFVSFDNSLF